MNTDIMLQKIDELTRKVNILLESIKHISNSQSEWIDKEETLRILKCSERTLQTLRDKRILIPSNPFGGSKFFYLRKDVMALFEKNFPGKI
jgi:hypothetical protein